MECGNIHGPGDELNWLQRFAVIDEITYSHEPIIRPPRHHSLVWSGGAAPADLQGGDYRNSIDSRAWLALGFFGLVNIGLYAVQAFRLFFAFGPVFRKPLHCLVIGSDIEPFRLVGLKACKKSIEASGVDPGRGQFATSQFTPFIGTFQQILSKFGFHALLDIRIFTKESSQIYS